MHTTPESPRSEQSLVDSLRRRDPAAFETLLHTYGGSLLAVARRLLADDADARDALQDAFISAYQSIDRFSGASSIRTWLHRIVVNASLMKLRTRRRRPERSIEELLPAFAADGHHARQPVSAGAGPAQLLSESETRALVRRKIQELPESFRTVLVLRDIEELDTDEAAQVLGLTPGAVKTRLHRARQALRSLLDPYLGAEGT